MRGGWVSINGFKLIRAVAAGAGAFALFSSPPPRRPPIRAPTSRWCSPAAAASHLVLAESVEAFVDALRSQSWWQVSRRVCGQLPGQPISAPRLPLTVSTGSGRQRSCRVHGGELPEHQDGARRILPGCGRDRFRHLGVPYRRGCRLVRARADAAGSRQPCRRGRAVRKTIGSVPARCRRTADRHRPAVSAQDHRPVRSRRPDLR